MINNVSQSVPVASAISVLPQARMLVTKGAAVSEYQAARARLLSRKVELEGELLEIENALKDTSQDAALAAGGTRVEIHRLPEAPANRMKGQPSLTSVIQALLSEGPLTKRQIVEALQQSRFPFTSQPMQAVNSVVYQKKFRREGKLFFLAGQS